MTVKILSAFLELLIPYVLEYIIDRLAPRGQAGPVAGWGLVMVGLAWAVRWGNIFANQSAVAVSRDCTRALRQDLFARTLTLSGSQADRFGLPSLISRMTSDSYNVQNFITSSQTVGVRAPIMLVGGVCVALTMDAALASVLCVLAPVMTAIVIFVSRKGVPLYDRVQQEVDRMTRVMRENAAGVRVIKALRKEAWEERRFQEVNRRLTRSDLTASTVMAIPAPAVQMFMNLGLILVVLVGARRVDSGAAEPGVILAFLIYFNLILHSAMSFNRIFLLLSKAAASADRIGEVLRTPEDQPVLPPAEERRENGALIEFDRVSFTHAGTRPEENAASFAGGRREKCLDGISFRLKRGETLGIIGHTGAGKSTLIRLLMRFYDADEGTVYVDGRDVRTYERDALRRKFGVCFQNDMVFQDTLRANADFGRGVGEAALRAAVEDAQAAEYIDALDEGLDYRADIKGANLSGGQKQRLLVARALAGKPEILILDDSSSALDYKTDAAMRRAIAQNHQDSTLIMVAQRVSSVMGMTRILVMDNGRCVGHQELMDTCPAYRETYRLQMGEMT